MGSNKKLVRERNSNNKQQNQTQITEFMSEKNIQKLRNSFSKIFKGKKQKGIVIGNNSNKIKDN